MTGGNCAVEWRLSIKTELYLLLTEAPRISTQVSPGAVPGPRWTITFPLLQLTTRHQNIKLVSRHILHFTTYSVPLKELPLVFYQIDISIEGMFYEDVRKDFLQFSCVICNISFLVCPRVQSIILQPSRDCSHHLPIINCWPLHIITRAVN